MRTQSKTEFTIDDVRVAFNAGVKAKRRTTKGRREEYLSLVEVLRGRRAAKNGRA